MKVEIVEISTNKVIETIGQNLDERRAEKVMIGVLINLNTDKYLVRAVDN